MARELFAIGDLQGCLESLKGLLEQIPEDAELLFLGDIVNRGPESLETLRFVKNLGNRADTLLGNHDLHLLAIAETPSPTFCRLPTATSSLSGCAPGRS